MATPFKMKGYSYPGKSPMKQEKHFLEREEVAVPKPPEDQKDSKYEINVREELEGIPAGERTQKPELPPDKVSTDSKYVGCDAECRARKKEKKKARRKEHFSNLRDKVAKELLTTGITAGLNALTTPRKRKEHVGPDVSGFMEIEFGSSSNILKQEKI